MAVDGAADFIVVWVTNESGVEAIMGQRYASTGQLSGGLISVSPPAATNQQAPAVAMAPDGRFLVVWQSAQANGGGWTVVGQAFTAGGAAVASSCVIGLVFASLIAYARPGGVRSWVQTYGVLISVGGVATLAGRLT